MRVQRFLLWYRLLYIFAFLSAISPLPIIWVGDLDSETRKRILWAVGACFWVGFLLELLLLIPCSHEYWYIRQKLQRVRIPWRGDVRIGVLSFARDLKGLISDIIALLLVILVTILFFLRVKISWIVIPAVTMALFSINLRCLLNGKNRNLYLKIQKQRRLQNENGGTKT